MTGLLCTLAFLAGMAFMQFLNRLDRPSRPEVTPWGESTRFWSDVDWEWYHSGQPTHMRAPDARRRAF